jgi:AAHS family 4-hydroxybenzoate transporter-like MFS transporter
MPLTAKRGEAASRSKLPAVPIEQQIAAREILVAEQPIVQVSRLLDERGLSAFHVKLIAWTALVALVDGYDIGAIAFAAPELVKDWHLERGALGPVFSSSLIGVLIGSGLFGFIGDRFGRKAAMVGSLLLFGAFTWIAAYATSLDQMFWLRFLAGIGIGGIIPNVVSINTESAPRRLRGTLPLIAVGFVPLGGSIPGLVSALLVPHYGWQILFLIGGIAPLVIAVAAMIGMPESIKYMALHESGRRGMERLVAAIRPGLPVPADARFVIEDEKQFAGFNPLNLFRDGLALITPLLWLLFALNLMGFFFLASWTPTLLTAAHLPPATAALATSAIQVGGTLGSWLLARWIDRHRFLAITLLFVLAVPAVGAIGFAGAQGETALLVTTFLAGFCVLGIQSGINVCGALVYPTSLRANGSGWELGIGRFGSIVGPLLGGLFVGMPVERLYLWSSLPFALGAVICFAIHRLNTARVAQQGWTPTARAAAAE